MAPRHAIRSAHQQRRRPHATVAAAVIGASAWLTALAGLALPAQAGGGTAGSLLSRQAAIQQATLWMPPGARITSTDCTQMVIDSSARYVCTVQWGPSGQ